MSQNELLPQRRAFLVSFAAGGFLLATEFLCDAQDPNPATSNSTSGNEFEDAPEFKPKTRAQLKRSLSAIQYKVTQEEGTEPAFANKYWNNKKAGLYSCIVCGLPLFDSKTKFESGTGWPSFYAPLYEKHLGTKVDRKMQYPRTEVHCKRCGAHLGHVFSDGPQPTGLRFCMNSASLTFKESAEQSK